MYLPSQSRDEIGSLWKQIEDDGKMNILNEEEAKMTDIKCDTGNCKNIAITTIKKNDGLIQTLNICGECYDYYDKKGMVEHNFGKPSE
jgi:hypothetical protein